MTQEMPTAKAYGLLTIERRKLLIPQREIVGVEPVADIKTRDAPPGGIGWLSVESIRWPVFCVSGDLDLMTIIPKTRRGCVLLRYDTGNIGLLFDELVAIDGTQLQLVDLPYSMKTGRSPVKHIIELGGEIGLVSDSLTLAEHLGIKCIESEAA